MITYDVRKLLGSLVVAEINFGGPVSPSIITPFEKIDDDEGYLFYWDIGPSYASAEFIRLGIPERGQAKILYVYGPEYKRDSKHYNWDKVDLHFLKAYYFPKPQDPPEPDDDGSFLGFISPDGQYYQSIYGNHDGTARSILACLFDEVISGRKAREKLLIDWIQILGKNYIVGRKEEQENSNLLEYTITAEQKEVARKIESFWDGADFWSLEFREVV